VAPIPANETRTNNPVTFQLWDEKRREIPRRRRMPNPKLWNRNRILFSENFCEKKWRRRSEKVAKVVRKF
jgi:hypothetical protein